MGSINNELALYGSENLCDMTDTVLLPISEVSEGTVSLMTFYFGDPCNRKLYL